MTPDALGIMTEAPPVRIQRLRTKGFNLQAASPDGRPVVYVGRPTMWGSPFDWREYRENADRRCLWTPGEVENWCREMAQDDFARWLRSPYRDEPRPPADQITAALRGKHLACWCRLDQPCHADVLLELANR